MSQQPPAGAGDMPGAGDGGGIRAARQLAAAWRRRGLHAFEADKDADAA